MASSDRFVDDFSYLQHALLKCVRVVSSQDEEGNWKISEDLDEKVIVRWRSPEDNVWRRIPVNAILPGSSEPRIGEYWAQMLEQSKPEEPARVVSEIRAELTPPRAEPEAGSSGPVYVRACSNAFDLLKNAQSELRTENERLATRLAKANDDNDRLRTELHEVRSQLLEAEARMAELEEELDGGPLEAVMSLVTEVIQKEAKQSPPPPVTDPSAPVLPEGTP